MINWDGEPREGWDRWGGVGAEGRPEDGVCVCRVIVVVVVRVVIGGAWARSATGWGGWLAGGGSARASRSTIRGS